MNESLEFIKTNWKLRATPTPHPYSSKLLVGFTFHTDDKNLELSFEEAERLLLNDFLTFRTYVLRFVELSEEVLVALYSFKAYLGDDFWASSAWLGAKSKDLPRIKACLRQVSFATEQRLWHIEWAKLRAAELKLLEEAWT